MNRIISFLSLALIAAQVGYADSSEYSPELQHRSEWWPDRVALREPVTGPLNQQTIKAGRLGFVIRVVDEDQVLIDFGRFGIIKTSIEQTDFVERYDELQGKRQWGDLGNWTAQLFTKLMVPNPNGFHTLPMASYDEKDYFVIFYADVFDANGQYLLNWMREAKGIKEMPANECLTLIPAEHNMSDYLLELLAYEYPGVTLVTPLAQPYRKILHHQPQGAVMTVIDKNGRQVTPLVPIAQGDDLDAKFTELQRRISQDVDFRRTLSTAE